MALYEYSRTRGYTPYRRGSNYVNEYNRWRRQRLQDEAALQDAYRSEEDPRVIEVHARPRKRRRHRGKSHLLRWFIGICLLVLALVFLNLSLIIAENFATISTPNFTQANAITNYTIAKEQSARNEADRASSVNIENAELLSHFLSPEGLNVGVNKANGLLACYNACTSLGLSNYETIGLMACAWCEGNPGLVQGGYPYSGAIQWAGVSNVIPSPSTGKEDTGLYVDSREKVEALLKMEDYTYPKYNEDKGVWEDKKMAMGIGTAQWTYGRCYTYLRLLLEMYPNQATYTKDELYAADVEMYKREFTSSYKDVISELPQHNDTLEHIVGFSLFKYEAGYGNRNTSASDPFVISAYNGRKIQATFQKRYDRALELESLFKEIGLI